MKRILTKDLLMRCHALAADPRATVKEIREAVQCAYELGVSEGRLVGKMEMGEQLLGMKAAVPT